MDECFICLTTEPGTDSMEFGIDSFMLQGHETPISHASWSSCQPFLVREVGSTLVSRVASILPHKHGSNHDQ